METRLVVKRGEIFEDFGTSHTKEREKSPAGEYSGVWDKPQRKGRWGFDGRGKGRFEGGKGKRGITNLSA